MPARAALISMLIVERPLCTDCIASRVSMSAPEVEQYLDRMRGALTVRQNHDRCRACGISGEVVSLERMPL